MLMRKFTFLRKFYVVMLTALCAASTAVASTGDYKGLVLNELNGNDKFIELYNKGTEAIALKGVYIEKDGKNVWKAGDITLEAGAYLLLYSEDVIAEEHPDYEGSGLVFSSGLSAKKEVRVQLFTPAGASLDDFNLVNYSIPASASYSRCPDGTGAWTYADATPGAANAESTILVDGLADPEIDEDDTEVTPVDYSGLVLNELNGNDKFIELYNKGTEAIALKGVYIEKDEKNVWKAGDITLEAGAYLLLYSEDVIAEEHPDYEGSGLVFSSGLSAKKAVRVQLFTPQGVSLDDFNLVDYSIPAPASYSRCPDGTGAWTYADATPGTANAESTTLVDGLVNSGNGDATGVKDMKTGTADNVYYDLQGRRVFCPTAGLYIVNGKKVIIK